MNLPTSHPQCRLEARHPAAAGPRQQRSHATPLWALALSLLLALAAWAQPARAQSELTHQFSSWPIRLQLASEQTGQPGLADPYPSAIYVLGIPDDHVVVDFEVVLNRLSYGALHDLDFLLVAPNGRSSMVLSDVRGWGMGERTIIIRDGAPSVSELVLTPGPVTIGPSNVDDLPDRFPAPAPQGGWGAALAPLTQGPVNGWWHMYVVNSGYVPFGKMDSWSVVFRTQSMFVESPFPPTPGPTPPIPEPGTWALMLTGVAGLVAWRRRQPPSA